MSIQFTGTCICGHSWDDHHHGVILNPQPLVDREEEYRNVDGILGEECEATQFEGMRISLSEPECYCMNYHDKGWPTPER